MKALLLENVHPEAFRLLEEAGLEVTGLPSAHDEAELATALPGVALLGIRSKTRLSAAGFAAAPDLIAVGAFCIGTDQIDLAAAAALGVAVFNAPYSNTRSVVELTLAEIVALTRRLTEKDRGMHAGVWDKSARGAHEVRGRTLGIVGYGNIGAQLSVVGEALGMRVVFHDTADKLALAEIERLRAAERAEIVLSPTGAASLANYDRIARSKGTAISEALNQKCTACQMMVRPQRWNDLRDNSPDSESGHTMMSCENCGRGTPTNRSSGWWTCAWSGSGCWTRIRRLTCGSSSTRARSGGTSAEKKSCGLSSSS